MEIAFKYRIYPNKEQKELINKTFGCCRFVYNEYLGVKISKYKESKESLSYVDCANQMKSLKDELLWLKEVDSTSLQSSLKDLDRAFQNFFKHHTGYPKFKSKKDNHKSYQSKYTNGNIQYLGKYIKLPKLGYVKTKNKLIPLGRIINATISQVPSGKYYVSLCCADVPEKEITLTGNSIGIDLGLKDFLITSYGEIINNPKYYTKQQKKLAKFQKELSRKTRGSSNRNKARIKVAKQHEKVANQRKDFLHKTANHIIQNYDIVCVEDLQIKNMVRNRKLSKCISDVSWSEFIRLLEYKARWHGKTIVKVDKFYPSSQICSGCGENTGKKTLDIRHWECPFCGANHDRDINAAINIHNKGLEIHLAQ